ncbi:esterase/lipase family protein [Brevibacillus daliensis]|uniref:esterase/lipase family protein n=1 Tax=Brevibacillus daliensis TaxID=2892995 RepID=UPI001E2EAB77|nr:alpha/beta fold hydrolase [Brevibacillus daliensis]
MNFWKNSNLYKKEGLHKVRQNGNDATIIFVHGLQGHPYHTWTKKGCAPLPQLFLEDVSYSQYDLYTFGYKTGFILQRHHFKEISNLLFSELKARIHNKEIYFVSHSMGGVIVQNMLIEQVERENIDFTDRVRGIVYLAVPFAGSGVASLASAAYAFMPPFIGKYVVSIQVRSLQVFSKELADQSVKWVRYTGTRLAHIKQKNIYGNSDLAVGKISSNPPYIQDADLVEEDHRSICKMDTETTVYHLMVQFFNHRPTLGYTSHMENLLRETMPRLATLPDNNLKAIGHLLAERANHRIKKFIALEQESWQHGYTQVLSEEYFQKLYSLFNLEEDYKTKMYKIIESIQEGSAIKVLFDEYLELEKKQFKLLAENFRKGQFEILLSTGKSFQFILRSLLATLIDKHNENVFILIKYFDIDITTIENQYKLINTVINYESFEDKKITLNTLLDQLTGAHELILFFDSKEKIEVTHPIISTIPAIQINGDLMGFDEIKQYIASVQETVSFDGKVFADSVKPSYIIFLIDVDDATKKALSIIQQRSNFGIYYLEKQ